MTQILLRYSKDRSCNELASHVDPRLDLGIFNGFDEDPCEILNLNSRITHNKHFYHTEKIFIEVLINFS